MKSKKALLSVSDKTGVVSLARGLEELGWEILSTGGTGNVLQEAGVSVTEVSTVTKHDEIMEGRVKTLHPAVHAGILARRDSREDIATLGKYGYEPIDLVVVNLYPFEETIVNPSVTMTKAMAQVDVGGPTMLRAAAKNHKDVWVLVDPGDYTNVLTQIREEGSDTGEIRQILAGKVFQHLRDYDGCIADYLSGESNEEAGYPSRLECLAEIVGELRYGENPNQKAAFYSVGKYKEGLAALRQLQGKSLSYNNLLDLDGALLSLAPFAHCSDPVTSIVKHTTPCGLARGGNVLEAYTKAYRCDPQSAFGSVIAANREIDVVAAEEISKIFVECVVAPSYSEGALEVLKNKKNVRLMAWNMRCDLDGKSIKPEHGNDSEISAKFLANYGRRPNPVTLRSVYGGLLVQDPAPIPFYGIQNNDWMVVTEVSPTTEELDDLSFAWSCVFGVKSNAIVLVQSGKTIGIGAGQMSRVDSSRLAVLKAVDMGVEVEGSVLASDAFFPFRDGVDAAGEVGVRAIIQPGGSIRDEEVIQAANDHGISMVFTGSRTFRH
ncbi:MAG: bifunctional phosphoribosylaminoimidazolecarboxamide formyltransferase/inosine monophosphate cyclohydrolase [Gemmatimonadetes bacterium]|nr:bifunctional phosphoribosylaminoimidazolecarboxamide formyltransferase/inosine monophosphate cyclohydrolase [Gemmatimonadota bacterium]